MTSPGEPSVPVKSGDQRSGALSAHISGHLDGVLSGALPVSLHFQPIADLSRAVVAGYEALARFPADIAQSPNVWFESAASCGRRTELEHLVVRKALAARKLLPPNCFLTVNLGAEYLTSPLWQELICRTRDLSSVVFEITEETAIEDFDRVRACLKEIREKGGSVAIDDAGAGYAGLHHILEMKPDFVKIDRHFIQDCHFDRAKSAIIQMVGSAASTLDAWIIAEGVETLQEIEELLRLRVPLAQGYLLGRPQLGMRQLESAAVKAIHNRTSPPQQARLLEYVTSCDLLPSRETAELSVSAARHRTAIVVDVWGRPLRVVDWHPLVGLRSLASFTKAQESSEPLELLQRALVRPEAQRFDPIVVVGPEGQALGILPIDRLASSLLASSATQSRNPAAAAFRDIVPFAKRG